MESIFRIADGFALDLAFRFVRLSTWPFVPIHQRASVSLAWGVYVDNTLDKCDRLLRTIADADLSPHA
jgi:hypothetical protein